MKVIYEVNAYTTDFFSVDGPALLPVEVQTLQARASVHPSLRLPTLPSRRRHLKWNVREPATLSLESTRHIETLFYTTELANKPATFPRLQSIRILVLSSIPAWAIVVKASTPPLGVTCKDVVDAIGSSMQTPITTDEYKALDSAQRTQVARTYYANKHRASLEGADPTTPHTAGHLRRVETLGQETEFAGIEWKEVAAGEDEMSHCTFVLHVKLPTPSPRRGSGDAGAPRPIRALRSTAPPAPVTAPDTVPVSQIHPSLDRNGTHLKPKLMLNLRASDLAQSIALSNVPPADMDLPATQPPVRLMRIVCDAIPQWPLELVYDIPITLGNVLQNIHEHMMTLIEPVE